MKTLKDFTTALEAAGCTNPRMERSYKRAARGGVAAHREVLVVAWHPADVKAKKKDHEAIAAAVFQKLRADGFELTHESWEYGANTHIVVQAKVASSDQY